MSKSGSAPSCVLIMSLAHMRECILPVVKLRKQVCCKRASFLENLLQAVADRPHLACFPSHRADAYAYGQQHIPRRPAGSYHARQLCAIKGHCSGAAMPAAQMLECRSRRAQRR